MTVTPPRSDTENTPAHSPHVRSASGHVRSVSTDRLGGATPDTMVETLMQGMQRMSTGNGKPSASRHGCPSPPEDLDHQDEAGQQQPHEYARRHSMPNVVGGPMGTSGSRFSQPSNTLAFIPEHRPLNTMPQIQYGGPMPPMHRGTDPMGAIGHARNSAPSYGDVPSAAQWYFGATPSSSLTNLLPTHAHVPPPPGHYGGGHRGGMQPRMSIPNMGGGRYSNHHHQQQQQQGYGGNGGGYSFEYQTGGLPAGAVCPQGSLRCYLVQFTSGRTDTYYVPYDSTMNVTVGDYVVVEADRGEDLGRVFMDNITVPLPRRNSTCTTYGGNQMSQYDNVSPTYELDDFASNNISGYAGSGPGPTPPNFPKRIYRIAQPVEIESLLGKVRDEINAIAVGQYKVQEWKLPMAIIDAEYQWDRRKLTFFFSVTLPQFYPNQPPPRIDFRTLVRDLYQIYRTRIWMYCVDKEKAPKNRAYNREKFLKQLYKDSVDMGMTTPPPGYGGSSYGNAGRGSSSYEGNPSSSRTTPVENEEWDIREVFKTMKASVDVDELSFGMAGKSSSSALIEASGNGGDATKAGNQDNVDDEGKAKGSGEKLSYSATAKTIWSEKPPSVTRKYSSASSDHQPPKDKAHSGQYEYYVDYGGIPS